MKPSPTDSTALRSQSRIQATTAVLVILALVVSACSSSSDSADPIAASSQDSASNSDSTDEATSDETGNSANAATDSKSEGESEQTEAAEQLGLRTISHALGETEVPTNPQRLVVLSAGTILPTLLLLDVPVIGAPLPEGAVPTLLLSEATLAQLTSVGWPKESLELIAELKPDMILGFDSGMEDTYDQLSQIAPTVAVTSDLNDWKNTAKAIAAAVGREDEMATRLAAYEQRIEALHIELGDDAQTEVSIVRARGEVVRLHTRFHFAGQVLDEVGFTRPDAQQTDDPSVRYIQISLELLEEADADLMFVFGTSTATQDLDAGIGASIQAIVDHPLFPSLQVAKNDSLIVVDPLAWQQGGLAAANVILDDVEAAFGVSK